MTTLLVAAMVAIALGLVWSWWSGRIGRDPTATVGDFHRALSAMSPEERGGDRQRPREGGSDDGAAGD